MTRQLIVKRGEQLIAWEVEHPVVCPCCKLVSTSSLTESFDSNMEIPYAACDVYGNWVCGHCLAENSEAVVIEKPQIRWS